MTVPAGGFKVALSCNSRLVEGHGNTLTAAAVNARGFAEIGGDFGIYCSTASFQGIGGGYRIGLTCNSRAVQSAGSTITDAGVSALGFADLAARTGRYCANLSVQAVAGGYRMTVLCTPGGWFTGQGPTVSAAAAATLQAAF